MTLSPSTLGRPLTRHRTIALLNLLPVWGYVVKRFRGYLTFSPAGRKGCGLEAVIRAPLQLRLGLSKGRAWALYYSRYYWTRFCDV